MEQHNHAILRVHCPDQSGIITVITGFINEMAVISFILTNMWIGSMGYFI